MATELQFGPHALSQPSKYYLYMTCDLIPGPAGGGGASASKAKLTLLTSHAHSSLPLEGLSGLGCASLNPESNSGSGNYDSPASNSLLRDSQPTVRLKLLPMNEQTQELQI